MAIFFRSRPTDEAAPDDVQDLLAALLRNYDVSDEAARLAIASQAAKVIGHGTRARQGKDPAWGLVGAIFGALMVIFILGVIFEHNGIPKGSAALYASWQVGFAATLAVLGFEDVKHG
jgi:hypothetical protein